ncbi:hypothetical protein QQP08_011248 [Theobroma cacao]|nr:hypothetical protein QQP08_011248 [Theobroma cacao]
MKWLVRGCYDLLASWKKMLGITTSELFLQEFKFQVSQSSCSLCKMGVRGILFGGLPCVDGEIMNHLPVNQ